MARKNPTLPGFNSDDLLAQHDRKLNLSKRPTRADSLYESDEDFDGKLRSLSGEISALQTSLFASRSWSLLLIFQGMDTSGKDGAIKHVFTGLNPQGCHVSAFRAPTDNELDHDFLWRVHAQLPVRGQIGVFNRSYYEEVLIARVHPEILAAERLPKLRPKKIWDERFDDIRWFEAYLERQGTRVIKIFLHLSQSEQRARLLARLKDPSKRWKFDPADVRERGKWKDYERAYEEAIAATHAKHSPWYLVPADDKKNARLMISQILLESLQALDIPEPALSAERNRELDAVQRALQTK